MSTVARPETLELGFAINDMREVVGFSEDAQFIACGFLYRAGILSEVPGFGGETSDVRDINNFSEVAGSAFINVSVGAVVVPFFARPGQATMSIPTETEIQDEGRALGISGFRQRARHGRCFAVQRRSLSGLWYKNAGLADCGKQSDHPGWQRHQHAGQCGSSVDPARYRVAK